ncbi:MAG: hypothetical protein KBS44_08010 [Clostridiales bacterium]|nr:hypothetical protein [Candidatus Coliplasma equi]
MEIPNRRKKEKPSKTVAEMAMIVLISEEDSFMTHRFRKVFGISDRTLKRYVAEVCSLPDFPKLAHLKGDLDEYYIESNLRLYDFWDGLAADKVDPNDKHLLKLRRMMDIFCVFHEHFLYALDPYDGDEKYPLLTAKEVVGELSEYYEKTKLALRTVQRDIADIYEAVELYPRFDLDINTPIKY